MTEMEQDYQARVVRAKREAPGRIAALGAQGIMDATMPQACVQELLSLLRVLITAYDVVAGSIEPLTLAPALKDACWELWRVLGEHAQGVVAEEIVVIEALCDHRPAEEPRA